jgi:hypothetical protein
VDPLTILFNEKRALPPPLPSFNPANPGAYGYSLVFNDDFATLGTIDVSNTGNTGYGWYCRDFFGGSTPARMIQVANGELTLLDSSNNSSIGICTAAPSGNGDGFVGRVFGGGAYFEARIKFNPAGVNPSAGTGWPAFWSNAIELWVNNAIWNARWPGQAPTYNHFAALDFFAFNLVSQAKYSNIIHDWYGIKASTCGGTWYCEANNTPGGGNVASAFINGQPRVPPGTDWTQYHTIGQLWVPGSAASGFMGYVQGYFDGLPTKTKVTWVSVTTNPPPPPMGTYQFSIIDAQHMAVVLGTGKNVPFTVDWVHVWQINGLGTMVQR